MPSKSTLESELQKIRRLELEREAERKSKSLGFPYLNMFGVPIQQEALILKSKEGSKSGGFLIFQKQGKKLRVATADPANPILQETIRDLARLGFETTLYFVSPQSIAEGLKQYERILPAMPAISKTVEISSDRIRQFLKKDYSLDDARKRLEEIDLARITEGLELIFSLAIKLDASDIHFEPKDAGALLRFRIDGILRDIILFDGHIFEKILARIKILAELKLNITASAQDGRFSIEIDDGYVEIRVSTIPTKDGESIALRILNPKKLVAFEDLGLRQEFVKILEKELAKTTGMLLVTGPTGSGKTTTLYAFLKKLASPDVKIITIEDPIEYRLNGISQTAVEPKKGYTFINGLRAILRQDPDIILVGEIRDKDTAETALHAALTGHLVFSTLHTNDAAGTIARLIDMDINPNIIAPAINAAVAQRLVRKVCRNCANYIQPDLKTKNLLKMFLKTLPAGFRHATLPENIKIPAARGCEACTDGYKGRVGIFEIFAITKDIEKLILQNKPTSELREFMIKTGMLTMQQDGILKVMEGITTLEEIERATGEIELHKTS